MQQNLNKIVQEETEKEREVRSKKKVCLIISKK